MKKVLSVLLTAAMLLSCFSVGLVSFAAAPADEATMAKQLKDTTTYATQETIVTTNVGKWNESSYRSIPANYTFSKTEGRTVTLPTEATIKTAVGGQEEYEAKVLTPILNSGKYDSYITRDSYGAPSSINVTKLVSDTIPVSDMLKELGVQSVSSTQCQPGTTGNNPIGDDALKIIDINAEDIKNYNTSSGRFELDDIVIADQTDLEFVPATTEDSTLAKIVSVIASSKADEILTALKEKEGVSDITNYVFKLTKITVTPSFSSTTLSSDTNYGDVEYKKGEQFTKLSGLTVSYSIALNFDVRFDFCDTAFPVTASQNITHSYTSFVERRADSATMPANEIVDIINKETAYVSAGTEDHHAGGYTFSKKVTVQTDMHTGSSSTIEDKYRPSFDNVLKTHPEYNQYLNTNETSYHYGEYYDDSKGEYAYDTILMGKVGLLANGDINYDGTKYSITKGVNGEEVLGIDALMGTTLTTDDIKTYSYYNTGTRTANITFNDQEIIPSDGNEAYIASVYTNLLPEGFDTELAESFRADHYGSSIENISVKYLTPTVTATFDNDFNLTSLTLTYKISYSASVYLADIATAVPVSGVYNVDVKYESIQKFDEANDIDPYELANAINEATSYAEYNKAGYSYERNANFAGTPQTDISASTLGTITGLLDQISSALAGIIGGGSDETITDRVSKAVTSFVTEDMDVTDYNNNVPVGKDGKDYIGESYALKATALEPNDLTNIVYNADRGVITFKLRNEVNPEKDESNALSRLTNDFTTASELKSSLGLQIAGIGIPLAGDDEPCDVTYTNINCYVAFTDADESNVFGDGTLSILGVGYNCTLNAAFSGITIKADTKMASEYNKFNNFEYEMGDVDMSTRVSIVDAKMVLQAVAQLRTIEGKNFELGDMNYDGKLSIVDAKKILQKIVNK